MGTNEGFSDLSDGFSSQEIGDRLRLGELFVINPRRKNGLILCKHYHADFAGPGSVIGSIFDKTVVSVIRVGKLSLLTPQNSDERQKAYLLRRQWVRLLKQTTDIPIAIERSQTILNQFENWFDLDTTASISDEIFAQLVGVLPQTIRLVRSRISPSDF